MKKITVHKNNAIHDILEIIEKDPEIEVDKKETSTTIKIKSMMIVKITSRGADKDK